MGGEVVAVALVDPEVERLHKPPRLDLLVEQPWIDERHAVAAHRILRRQLLGVEHQAAIDRKVGSANRAHEHLPEEVARPSVDLDVQEIAARR